MLHLDISDAEILNASYEIVHNSDPVVRKKMLVMVLKSVQVPHGRIAELAHCHPNTVTNYLHAVSEGGIDGLALDRRHGPEPGMAGFEDEIKAAFKKEEPANAATAAKKLEVITGTHVSPRTANRWMRALGMKYVKPIAVPSKADVARQWNFLTFTLMPLLMLALSGRCKVFFMDAAHFIHSASLGARWCFQRGEVKAPPGRDRHNVLAALDPVTKLLAYVTEAKYINAQTVVRLLTEIRKLHKGRVIWIVLDNAAYQRCALVEEAARDLKINLLYLPPYSPNLNLIERLWRLLRKRVLDNKYYEKAPQHREAIDNFLNDINEGKYADDMESLITLNFQTFKESQIAVA